MRHLGKAASILVFASAFAAAGASAQTSAPAAGGAASAKPAAKARASKPRAARANAPNIVEVCGTDIGIFCGDIERKGGNAVRCLVENQAIVSQNCAAALPGKGH
jgi:hypothetical protein